MKFWISIATLLGLVACSSNPKPWNPADRNPANWSDKVGVLKINGELKDFKLTFAKNFDMSLVKHDVNLPTEKSTLGLAIPNPGQLQIYAYYAAFFQNGSLVKPDQLNNTSPICRVMPTGARAVDLTTMDSKIKTHFSMGGGWSEDLIRRFKIPPATQLIEVPREVTISSIQINPGIKIRDATNVDHLGGLYPSTFTSTTKEILFEKRSSELSFTINGNVKSFHTPNLVVLSVHCSAGLAGSINMIKNGNWSYILNSTMGDYVSGVNVSLSESNLTDIPEAPVIKIQEKAPKTKKVKTIEI